MSRIGATGLGTEGVSYLGGAKIESKAEFVGLEDLDQPDIPFEQQRVTRAETGASFGESIEVYSALNIAAESGKPAWLDVAAYPEDTVADIRVKIYAATGVPPYRQHIFYTTGDGILRVPYNFYVEGVPVLVDARRMFGDSQATRMKLSGLPIEMRPRREEGRN